MTNRPVELEFDEMLDVLYVSSVSKLEELNNADSAEVDIKIVEADFESFKVLLEGFIYMYQERGQKEHVNH